MRGDFHVYMAAAGDGAAGGGAAGAAAGGAAAGNGADAAGAGGNNAAASGAGAVASTVLAAGAAAGGVPGSASAAADGSAGAAGGSEPGIPEKFIVKGADGKEDFQATALKLAREGYLPLEKRLGGGDAPPQSVDGYKLNVPEALAQKVKADDLAKDQGVKDFLGKLHAAGASQKVVDAAVSELLTRGAALREAMPTLAAADCEAELRGQDGWKTDTEYSQQIGAAFNAGKAIFGKDFDGIVKDYGNDPRLIRGLSSIAKEMGEDAQASPEAQLQLQESLDALMSSKAYLNANDPQHAAVAAKVGALTARMAGTKPVASGRTHTFKSG